MTPIVLIRLATRQIIIFTDVFDKHKIVRNYIFTYKMRMSKPTLALCSHIEASNVCTDRFLCRYLQKS